jgi:hypothetical protein
VTLPAVAALTAATAPIIWTEAAIGSAVAGLWQSGEPASAAAPFAVLAIVEAAPPLASPDAE